MATANETSSQRDVGKLALSLEKLRTSSAGPYTPIPIRLDFKPYYEDSKVNCKQTATHTPVYVGRPMPYEEQIANYSPVPWVSCKFTGPVAGECAIRDERPCEPCNVCSKEHPPHPYCPYVPCNVCNQLGHPIAYCPYYHYIPQGADFNKVDYEVVCSCGNLFNVDKWVCTYCTGKRPLLMGKYCCICRDIKQHSSYECPEDEVRAAKIKARRDHLLSVGQFPNLYSKACSLSASSGASVP